jgi:hypothetical protein
LRLNQILITFLEKTQQQKKKIHKRQKKINRFVGQKDPIGSKIHGEEKCD